MTKQTHTVATDALATLGTIIDETAGRDAIHLAVEPVVAGERLHPGDHIGRDNDGRWTRRSAGEGIGIVDPFLNLPVQEGQHFWLVIYPRQITSLRHVWEHPAFGDATAAPKRPKETSEAWLREFIARSDCPDYETVIAKALNNDSWDSDYLHFDGEDAHGEIPPEFYDHLEIVTGRAIPREDRASYFSCSC